MRYALLACAALTLLAQSQPPSPTPTKASQGKQDQKTAEQAKTEANQKAAEEFSSLVDKVTSEIARRNKQQSSQEGFSPASPDWWVAIFTGVLVVVGAIQVFVYCRQAGYMKRGLLISMRQTRIASGNARTARISADAADRSATIASDVFIASHRPRLSVRFMTETEEYGGPGGGIPISGVFRLFNTGDTKAVLDQYWFEIIIAKTLPAASPYEGKIGQTLTDYVLSPGGSIGLSFPSLGAKQISTEEFMPLANHRDIVKETGRRPTDTEDLFVIGWVSYRDETKQLRTSGFCHRYDFKTKRFERVHDPDYQYGDQG